MDKLILTDIDQADLYCDDNVAWLRIFPEIENADKTVVAVEMGYVNIPDSGVTMSLTKSGLAQLITYLDALMQEVEEEKVTNG